MGPLNIKLYPLYSKVLFSFLMFAFISCKNTMPQMHITSHGTIENEGTGMLQVGTEQKQRLAPENILV